MIPSFGSANIRIRIPGTFVVFQGIAGDGLSNTVDSVPSWVTPQPPHNTHSTLSTARDPAVTSSSNEVVPLLTTTSCHPGPSERIETEEERGGDDNCCDGKSSREQHAIFVTPPRRHVEEVALAPNQVIGDNYGAETERYQGNSAKAVVTGTDPILTRTASRMETDDVQTQSFPLNSCASPDDKRDEGWRETIRKQQSSDTTATTSSSPPLSRLPAPVSPMSTPPCSNNACTPDDDADDRQNQSVLSSSISGRNVSFTASDNTATITSAADEMIEECDTMQAKDHDSHEATSVQVQQHQHPVEYDDGVSHSCDLQQQQQNLSAFNLQQQQQEALEEWNMDRRENELWRQQEWLESAVALDHATDLLGSKQLLDAYNCTNDNNNNNNNNNNDCTTTTTAPAEASRTASTTPWWMTEDGCLALMEGMPLRVFGLTCGGFPRRKVGKLSPGQVVVATELITVCSKDLVTTIDVSLLLTGEEVDDAGIHRTSGSDPKYYYPPGRPGWVQFLRLEAPVPNTYCVLSIDGYSFLGPGWPVYYCDSTTWYWRVTCLEGAFVRRGLDLTSQQIAILPYGSLVRVKRKQINAMGLARLQIEAMRYNPHGGRPDYITGWISEFLNPLSGQRGPIAQPLPFPIPALYKVILPEGAIIRSDVELTSPILRTAPQGTVLTITGRAYSEHPKDQCIERYQLAGNGGWISVRLNQVPPHEVVKFVGTATDFDPNNPGWFHISAMRSNPSYLESLPFSSTPPPCQTMSPMTSSSSTSSTNEEIESTHRMNDEVSHSGPMCNTPIMNTVNSNETTTTLQDDTTNVVSPTPSQFPALMRSGTAASRSSARRRGRDPRNEAQEDRCLICLCEARTATIVHGETGHVACCLVCARLLKARNDPCPVCRFPIDLVVQHFWA